MEVQAQPQKQGETVAKRIVGRIADGFLYGIGVTSVMAMSFYVTCFVVYPHIGQALSVGVSMGSELAGFSRRFR